MFDFNNDDSNEFKQWLEWLDAAEQNAETDFEIEFCDDLRYLFEKYGANTRLSKAQQYKLRCIAKAGGFWERETW